MERKIIYHEDSEEYKAIKLLEQKTKNYSLDGEDLHYAIILYNLIINLSIENQQLKEKLKDVNKSLKNVQQRNSEYRNNCFELNKKQNDNWNKLKEYIGTEWYSYDNDSVEFEVARDILDKMQEMIGDDK